MAKDLTKVLAIDLEATCWDGEIPSGQRNEIIEIGLTVLDIKTGEREKHGILVKPKHSEISPFCTQLTTITPEMVDAEGVSFKEAMKFLKQFKPKERTWASWGDYDRRQFDRECREKGSAYPFGPSHINVKNLFALRYKLDREIGMAGALSKLNMPLTGTHHRGADDAWNIAGILGHILKAGDEGFRSTVR
jgi:inhibitor of KinA sporulation pathway (predicted exonuclease)